MAVLKPQQVEVLSSYLSPIDRASLPNSSLSALENWLAHCKTSHSLKPFPLTAAEDTALQVLSTLRYPVLRRRLRVILPFITPRPCKLALFLIDPPLFRLRVRVDHLVAATHTGSHACQTTSMLLARVCSIVSQLIARLSLSRVSQTRVHIAGCSSAEG